ncbi:hypothetical protein LPJ81_000431 [Coemansia sp. IMI 209127]|nr:hypothetical protein LPJ81_000431 [Coemansia sp. IMI 209127]
MVELTAQELAFGKRLAHVDKDVRDRALESISRVLSTHESISYMDMLRHWKALFYCFWLSDKPLVQQELAWDLAKLVLICNGDNRVTFVRAFWETLCREWFDIDKHRIDKYLLLMRRVVYFALKSMESNDWDEQLVAEYVNVYQEYPVNPSDPKVPNSIRTHVADIYVDEIVRLAAGMPDDGGDNQRDVSVSRIPVAVLLEPFMRFIGCSRIKHLPPKIQETVFADTVVRIAEAEERANAEAGSESDSSEDGGMDIDKDNQTGVEDLSVLQFIVDAIPDIKKRLLEISSEEGIVSLGRKRLHLLYQMLTDTFPDEERDVLFPKRINIKDPIGAEERKRADKHKRKKDSKKRELQERKKKARSLTRNMIAASADNLDINALENLATVEEERGYQEDIVKIREMEKRAGLDNIDELGKKAKSKKAMRVEKKVAKKVGASKASAAQDEIPTLVASGLPEEAPPHTNGKTARADSAQGDEWTVVKKNSNLSISNGTRKRKQGSEPSLLSELEKKIVVKEKSRNGSVDSAGNRVSGTPLSKGTISNDKQKTTSKPKKKRLSWGLDNNLTKRFLTKVPMLPSLEPVAVADEPKLKPALRKASAYTDGPATDDSSLLPLKPLDPGVVTTLVSLVKSKQLAEAEEQAHAVASAPGNKRRRQRGEHAKELGNAVPKAPFFFLKPTSSYVSSPGKIEIPRGCVVHHEVELGVVIGKGGRDIRAADAYSHVAGYALALDLTARNLQDEAKKMGLPWSAAKGFDTFTPIGEFIPAGAIPDPHKVRLWIQVAGQVKQDGVTDAMVFQIPQLIEHVSQIMTLEEGDLLLTGTPQGVGPVDPGDHVVAGLEYENKELSRIEFESISRD